MVHNTTRNYSWKESDFSPEKDLSLSLEKRLLWKIIPQKILVILSGEIPSRSLQEGSENVSKLFLENNFSQKYFEKVFYFSRERDS